MTIKEASQKTGLSSYTLRYYEKSGILSSVKRDKNGVRSYSEQNIETLLFIVCMKNTGFSLETIKKYMDLYNVGSASLDKRIDLLEKQKLVLMETLNNVQISINYIDEKIELEKIKSLDL